MPRYQRRRACLSWPFCRRRSLLLYALAAVFSTTVLCLLGLGIRTKTVVFVPRPHSQKPPLVDRFLMERLGMYDKPELIDQEWMGSRALHLSEANKSSKTMPLLVTALPDSKSAKHDRFVSNVLADWQLCGFRDRPCRLALVRRCTFLRFCSGSLISYAACINWRTRV